MGSSSYTDDCPKCGGKQTVLACTETRVPDISGECLKCGWHYWTETGQMTKEELDQVRKDNNYKGGKNETRKVCSSRRVRRT